MKRYIEALMDPEPIKFIMFNWCQKLRAIFVTLQKGKTRDSPIPERELFHIPTAKQAPSPQCPRRPNGRGTLSLSLSLDFLSCKK